MTQSQKPRLFFDKGTVCIKNSGLVRIPQTKFDEHDNKTLRSFGLNYKEIIEYLQKSDLDYIDQVPNYPSSPFFQMSNLKLRDYQKNALDRWIESSMRGCVVLPTGAGKTVVGIKAIEKVNAATLIIVPTIDLMEQWTQNLSRYLNQNTNDEINATITTVGNLGGRKNNIQPITVATYDSAYLRAPYIGNQFKLVIFDEVHHLPAPGYRSIAEQLIAPYRLGLSATIQREDGLDDLIPRLVGGIVFQQGPKELSEQKHLAEFNVERRQVNLTYEEQIQYNNYHSQFTESLAKLGFRIPSMHNIRRLIMMSNRNKIAREGLLARNKANEIALNSESKVEELQKILQENRNAKTIIFTQNNKMVYYLSNKFLIPFITYKTGKDERHDVLERFKSGQYNAVVTSKVLDEGIDVPDAELGIIVSGTGSGRELIQRLGRILRPKQDGKKARLIEIVSKQTRETNTSAKRITALRKNTESSVSSNEVSNADK
ncbi:DEAD/DEAH box helicase family protein [Nitrosopumilus sp.]|uniref:DEAD/DEAH box helicase family protein n=1 Tax=Nitrosopumilus sp. TaxID=2024843 RepID=UPI002930CCFF|nr:DEAD/DEAH box helicase family protein [Nitrosopumilus sp.]